MHAFSPVSTCLVRVSRQVYPDDGSIVAVDGAVTLHLAQGAGGAIYFCARNEYSSPQVLALLSRGSHFTVTKMKADSWIVTDINLGNGDSTYAHHMKDARSTILTPTLLQKLHGDVRTKQRKRPVRI